MQVQDRVRMCWQTIVGDEYGECSITPVGPVGNIALALEFKNLVEKVFNSTRMGYLFLLYNRSEPASLAI